MFARRTALASGLACAIATATAQAAPPRSAVQIVDEIDRLVRARFYAPELLGSRGWDQAVRDAREAIATAPASQRTEILTRLVASLGSSHTDYLPRDDPRYAQLIAIFEGFLGKKNDQCPDHTRLPPLPVTVPDIGVWWRQIDGRWFVGGVVDGGPAGPAGLLLGDEVATADGRAFQPVTAFAAGPGHPVQLGVRREQGGALRTISVAPRRVRPQVAFREAIGASAHLVEHGAAKVAYIRVWSWAGLEMQDALEEAIDKLNAQHPTGFVIDLRDGWGGAQPDFLRIFDTHVPVIGFTPRGGTLISVDRHIHVPAAVLINDGSHSGKEVVAYGIKKHHLARLVGERTGGAVLAGSAYCLSDGSAMYLASGAVTIDGEIVEGVGVAPDIAVPFDLRYAAGRDRQLDAALAALGV